MRYLHGQTKILIKTGGFYARFTPSKMKNGNRKLKPLQDIIQYFIQMNFNMSAQNSA